MSNLIDTILGSINFVYIILCNVITWLIIECINLTKFKDRLTTWMKRVIATIVAIGLGAVMLFGFKRPFEPMFYGFFIQYLSWDYFFKALVERVRNVIAGKRRKVDE